MGDFLDIHTESLTKAGEMLCGDKVKVLRTPERSIVVLSDGLGSGVKANILATLTCEILITMSNADVPLREVIRTVVATLPTCKVRHIAYATFTLLEYRNAGGAYKVVNFDNPPVFLFRQGRLERPDTRLLEIEGRKVAICEGELRRGDFLGLISDGVPYAGMGTVMNFGWGWENVAKHMEGRFRTHYHTARDVVRDVISETRRLYGGKPGDDATFAGVLVRRTNTLMVFTGPPVDAGTDTEHVERFLAFDGRRVVCGGTTATIVADYLGCTVETDLGTLRPDVPPIGEIPELDLVTEGILTLAKAIEYLKGSDGFPSRLPNDRNGAALLARELLRADEIRFLVGLKMNEFYQNPLLPKTISIRRSQVKEIADFLLAHNKVVYVDYC